VSLRLAPRSNSPIIVRLRRIYENRNIRAVNELSLPCQGGPPVREETRLAIINIAGLASLIVFTGLVYLRTQETLILLVGGLIAVVSVIGTTMGKT
jgi:hypothetical protein